MNSESGIARVKIIQRYFDRRETGNETILFDDIFPKIYWVIDEATDHIPASFRRCGVENRVSNRESR